MRRKKEKQFLSFFLAFVFLVTSISTTGMIGGNIIAEAAVNETVSLPDSLIGQYLFDNSLANTAPDAADGAAAKIWNSYINTVPGDAEGGSGAADDVTEFSYAEGIDGSNGGAAAFSGTGTQGLKLDVVPTSNAFTISFDIKLDTATQYTSALILYKNDGEYISLAPQGWKTKLGPMVWARSVNSDNSARWYDIPGGAAALEKISLQTWATVTVIVNDNMAELYVNGEKLAAGEVPDIIDGMDGIYVGINNWDTPLEGAIDNLYVYDAALTIEEVYANQSRKIIFDWTGAGDVAVHDPSVVEATDTDGTPIYYIFGSHLTQAKSKDLVNWKTFGAADLVNQILFAGKTEHGAWNYNIDTALEGSFAWAGSYAADTAAGKPTELNENGYGIWAPDVIWNADYVWEDGSEGAWMLYYAVSSTYFRSAIGYAVAKNIEGPYAYVDTIVYSGFSKDEDNPLYYGKNTDLLADMTASGTNAADYFREDKIYAANGDTTGTEYNNDKFPNAIDPNLVYTADGKLYMSYGSWSGGIFVLELDKTTGQPIRPEASAADENRQYTDAYFGRKIAAGNCGTGTNRYNNSVSGEAPYIFYDADTGYYYLFVTDYGLNRDEGYQMRLFRSQSVDGPYVDANNNTAVFAETDVANQTIDKYGIKVMGNYAWESDNMDGAGKGKNGYMAPGHNSVLQGSDGKNYLISHTRFVPTDTTTDTEKEAYQVKVHQLLMNTEDKWPVAAPFEYDGKKLETGILETERIAGKYDFINHGTDNDLADHKIPVILTLLEDGTATVANANGSEIAYTGTWTVDTAGGDMTLAYNGTTYKGVFHVQNDESAAGNHVLTFAATGNNETVWAVQKTRTDDAVSLYDKDNKNVSKKTVSHKFSGSVNSTYQLTAKFTESVGNGTVYVWTSSDPEIAEVDAAGKVTIHKEGKVTITVTIVENEGLATKKEYSNWMALDLTKDEIIHRPTDEDADNYFPSAGQDGSVTINKTATGENYNTTGTAKISLDILGIPEEQPIDIILVMDVSRSMIGLPATNDDRVSPSTDRAGDLNILEYKKLNSLRDSASDFIEQMLGTVNSKNRIALVQFANDITKSNGEYAEVNSRVLSYFAGSSSKDKLQQIVKNGVDTNATYEYVDGTPTDTTVTTNGAGYGYVGYMNNSKAEDRYDNVDMSGVGMTLSTEGGTNYGLAFKMVEKVIAADNLTEKRRKVIVFMTDGGPSVLNLSEDSVLTQTVNGIAAPADELRNRDYNETSLKTFEAWTAFAQQRHLLAKARVEAKGYEIITLGYDLLHDNAGYFGSDYEAAAVVSEGILESIATNKNGYYAATAENLGTVYKQIGENLVSDVKNTVIKDTIGDSFELRILPFYRSATDEENNKATNPTIEIYIGGKGSGSDGRVEKVTFYGDTLEDGITVRSDMAGTLCTITADNKESYIIRAKYFTYDAATKTFVYNIGILQPNTKYKIRYDAYLKGSNARYETTMGYLDSETDPKRISESIYETGFQQRTAEEFTGTSNISIVEEENGNQALKVPGEFARSAYGAVDVDFSKVTDGLTISMRIKEQAGGTGGYVNDAYNPLFTINWDNPAASDGSLNGFFMVRNDGQVCINTTHNQNDVEQNFVYVDTEVQERAVQTSDTWKTVTLTADKAAQKIIVYVDGVEVYTVTSFGGGTFDDLFAAIQKADNLWLGAAGDFWSWWSYNGYYDDVLVFNQALTAEQIAGLDRRAPSTTFLHDTNLKATASYENVNGDTCEQTYEIPSMPWNAGKITYKFYLAKETADGIKPIDYNAKLLGSDDPEDYTIIDSLSGVVDFALLAGTTAEQPGGTDFASQAGNSQIVARAIADGTYDYIFVDDNGNPIGTYKIYKNGDGYIETVDGGGVLLTGNDGTATDTMVYFPITLRDITTNQSDAVVLDYGLPVTIDLLANDNVSDRLDQVSLIGVSREITDLHTQENTVDTRFVDTENSALNINLEFTGNQYDVSDYAFRNRDKLLQNVTNTDGYTVEESALKIDGRTKTPGIDGLLYIDSNILNNASLPTYTFSTWINPSQNMTGDTILYTTGNDRWMEVTLWDPVAGAQEAGRALNVRTGAWTYYEDAGERKLSTTSYYDVAATTVVPYDAWTLVTFTYESGQIKIYYNGVLAATSYIANNIYEVAYADQLYPDTKPADWTALTDDSGNITAYRQGIAYASPIPSAFNSYNQNFYLGGSRWSGALLNAKLDGIKLYNAALTSAQISALYEATKDGYDDEVKEYGNDGAAFRKDGTDPLLVLKGENTYRDVEGIYGTLAIAQKDSITKKNANAVFTMKQFLEGEDNYQYALRYDYADHTAANYLYGNLKVLPANTVYYEDNFAGIAYKPEQEVTEGTTGIKQWQTVVSEGVKENQDFQLADMQSEDVNYGFDSNYADNMTDSNNTVTEMGSMALAAFTFTGTGFDIISRTNRETGKIAVVIKDENQKAISATIHNLYYDDGDLYQIPVISMKNLPYGTYTVQIQPRYKNDEKENQIFYLDGIRIYNPIGNEANEALREKYYADGENGAVFKEIRNELLGNNRMQLITYAKDGTVSLSNAFTTTEWLHSEDNNYKAEQSAEGWNDYLKRGPNNELYLSPGQAIIFQIQNETDIAYNLKKNSLQIGAKLPNGDKGQMTVKVGDNTPVSYDVNTKAELYYDVTNADCSQITTVIIANTSTASDSFLSLTNFKVNQYTMVDYFRVAKPEAGQIPAYYSQAADSDVYSFNNGIYEEYRIYGSYYNPEAKGWSDSAAWYICDKDGNLQGYQMRGTENQELFRYAERNAAELQKAEAAKREGMEIYLPVNQEKTNSKIIYREVVGDTTNYYVWGAAGSWDNGWTTLTENRFYACDSFGVVLDYDAAVSEKNTAQLATVNYVMRLYQICVSVREDTEQTEQEQNTVTEIKDKAETKAPVAAANPAKQSYKIRYVMNGGKNVSANKAVYQAGKTVKLKAAKRKGYKFAGWYTDKKMTKRITSVANKNVTVYAKWQKISLKKPKLTKAQITKTKAALSWGKVAGAAGYEIKISKTKKFTGQVITVKTGKRKLTVSKLKKKGNYYVKIRAYALDSAGKKVYSNYCTVKKIERKG